MKNAGRAGMEVDHIWKCLLLCVAANDSATKCKYLHGRHFRAWDSREEVVGWRCRPSRRQGDAALSVTGAATAADWRPHSPAGL